MEDLPHLSRRDVEAQLEQLFSHKRSGRHLFAFYGKGEEDSIRLKSAGEVRIIPVKSELELRARLPALGDPDARIAFLVPWTGDVPMDLAGRFAKSGRVMRIGRDARLRLIFGVPEVDPEAARSPLAEYLLRPGARSYPIPGGRLTLDLMWSAWLAGDWGLPVSGGLALDTLLGFAAADGRGPTFVEAMKSEAAMGVRDALHGHLARRLGPAGPVVFGAWEKGEGRAIVEYAVLFEALAGQDGDAVEMWIGERMRQDFGLALSDAREVATSLGREAAAALRWIGRTQSDAEVRALVRAADARVDHPKVQAALVESPRLPAAWTARLVRLGEHLSQAAKAPSEAHVERAVELLRDLETHAFFRDKEHAELYRRAEMAVRLLAWLVARTEEMELGAQPYGPVEALGRWYAAEGGYVDWARRVARGSVEDPFGRGVQAVLERADLRRTELDRRFAKALPAWVEAGRPATQVVSIEDAVRRITVPFLEQDPSRRLLILLMDGMAWAQAAELLGALGEAGAPWGPVAWHFAQKNKIGESIYPVMLASFPTVTEVSRAAFFAGKLMPPGKSQNTQDDPKRWKANKDVGRFFDGTDAPPLLLRSEAHTKGGAATTEALTMVGGERRVVAVVVNAIDESLKGDPTTRHRWDVDGIGSLRDLLAKAREAGRTVLLTSDHGHVRADRMTTRGVQSEGGARWRPLASEDEPLAEDEVALFGNGVWCPKGAKGVVMLADDTGRYGPVHGAGEHGGATLAEVVTPCLLIGTEDTNGLNLEDDPARAVRGALVPSWWHFEVTAPVVEAPPPVKPTGRKPKPKDERQLDLIAKKPEPVQVADSGLSGSPVLKAQIPDAAHRKEAVRALEFLLARNGRASADAFGAAMGVVPRRVGGLVSKLQEAVNLDGYELIKFESETRQVILEVEAMRLQFGLKG